MLQPLSDDDPRQVGPYRLQGRIGAGGMGIVYLGFGAGRQPVAVKVPAAGLADDPEFRGRFRTEVAAARRVRGRSVAEVLDADVDGPRPWMATEYVEGRSLTEAVALRGPFTGRLLDGLAVGLADALVAIHAAGVVHRDLKPSNILVTWEGPKVIDFGIARAEDSTSHTRTGTLVGTLVWMAPEQLRGERAGPPTDVFAWGACVVFAATGRLPFSGERAEAIAMQIMTAEPDLTGVPPALARVLGAALDKDPVRRPAATQLVAWLVGQDVSDAGTTEAGVTVAAARTALAQWWSLPPTPPQPTSGQQVPVHPAPVHPAPGPQPPLRPAPGPQPPLRPAPVHQPAGRRPGNPSLDQPFAGHGSPVPGSPVPGSSAHGSPADRPPAGYAQMRADPQPVLQPSRPRRRGTFAAVVATVLALAVLGGILAAMALRARDSSGDSGLTAAQTTIPGAGSSYRTTSPSSRRTTAPPTARPTPTAASATPGRLTLAEAKNTVNERGYRVTVSTGFVSGRTLNVLIGEDANSPSVPRQFAFFFVGTEMIGKDFAEPSARIAFVSAKQQTTIVLQYALYNPRDEICCPSAGTADVTFQWDGKKLNVDESTIPPSDPNVRGSRR